ncbi:glycosyltransferase family 9 protein [soil metagenome]
MNRLPEDPKILVIRTDNLGDVILTLPVITALKKAFPDSQISFLIKKYTSDVVENYPGISEVIHIENYPGLSKLSELFRAKKFDAVLNVYPRYKIALAGLFSNIPFRVGTAYRWYSFLFNYKVKVHRKDGKRHESDYNLDLVRTLLRSIAPIQEGFNLELKNEINFKTDIKIYEVLKHKLQSKYRFSFDSPYIIVHPFSKGSAKKWHPDNFVKFISKFQAENKTHTIFMTGDNSEKDLIKNLISKLENSNRVIDISGELSLKELIELINMSGLFISNSTGPLHIAGALNKKNISFFPKVIPTNSERWKPLGENSLVFEPESDAPDSDFIEGISPEKVVLKCHEILEN